MDEPLARGCASATPHSPVLYISAYPSDDLFHRGAPTSHAPYLQKPIDPEELLRVVQQLLVTLRLEPSGT